ncbi:biotin-dependent carboxyltransferase family protein [Ancylobacter sp. 6x-1]|uniref:Biotin-dependent carboxyltransferase family protein n=1 Tax=Ancylobacter crimeensis TaxID=2579147 RepID=A0ABT0DDY7_9HYPH|nr:biotin-dependent carboxyltransferase family protein [Ancylobacter crimeensis]MCK0198168.1 biotin-dependent carboxyltransferase family protein [Ancylobacter crimeensis]
MPEAARSFKVVKPGLATTVQDLGRPGYYHLGLPISGAMDRLALIAANRLVGNEDGAAALEAVFLGPELTFAADALVAVTGADLPPKVDGVEQPGWTAFTVAAGQTLSFGFLKGGARAYVAIAGGIDVPEVLGSRSTYALGALGGFEGRALKAGDVVPLGTANGTGREGASIPPAARRPVANEIRVLPGLYWHRITESAQDGFFEDTWKVAPEADRIGYRFRGGRKLDFVPREQPFGAGSDPSNIVDSCYPYGSIQVPGGTEPIVLHRDAVSGGGYFMIGAVISADMDLIGQLQPHQAVRFAAVTMEDALKARHDETARLKATVPA